MIEINYLALVLAVVASMAAGFIYYSPYVLGKPWMKLMGWNKDIKMSGAEMGRLYGTSALLAVITAFVLYHVMTMSIAYFGYDPLMTGLTTAFWMWLGFVMPVQATDVLFSKKPFKLFAINTGYQLVSLLVMGVVFGLVR
jgi:ABC-type multidrug transport system permease subunit